jgi:predicted alpha/beta-fold hydrolase
MPIIKSKFSPPFPFKNGHFSTMYRSIFMKESHTYNRRRITTWDKDFIDLDF